MKTYLVGGAVRDRLLGKVPSERDWVVVGESPKSMLDQGFLQVGKDFPVFLHPQTREEYALARKEYNVGPGHQGFKFDTGQTISLEEDLTRRDLTVNAIAQAPDGTLIDPCGGQTDLNQRLFRHVSSAFSEDPLRTLRLAQFQARFEADGFKIAQETLLLCRQMVQQGDLASLSRERVFKEFEKALNAERPQAFFAVLETIGALAGLLPGVRASSAFSLNARYPAATAEEQFTWLVLENPDCDIATLQTKIALPKHWVELARLSQSFASLICTLPQLSAEDILSVINGADARRRPDRFSQSVNLVTLWGVSDALQQTRIEAQWRQLSSAVAQVTVNKDSQPRTGKEIQAEIKIRQLKAITDLV